MGKLTSKPVEKPCSLYSPSGVRFALQSLRDGGRCPPNPLRYFTGDSPLPLPTESLATPRTIAVKGLRSASMNAFRFTPGALDGGRSIAYHKVSAPGECQPKPSHQGKAGYRQMAISLIGHPAVEPIRTRQKAQGREGTIERPRDRQHACRWRTTGMFDHSIRK